MSGPKLITGRVSGLNNLGKCPGLSALSGLRQGSGPAAQTGSAAHRIIELFHRGYLEEDAIRACLDQAAQDWPDADLDEARTLALFYMQDPRNRVGSEHGPVEAKWLEAEVRLSLPPAPEDPTGEPVVLVGHVDQIRRHPDGRLRVWDVKTGKANGLDLVHSHALQLAAYALACTETLGEPCLPGGIIRLRGYKVRGGVDPSEASAFFETPWSLEQCAGMLESAAWLVAALRQGVVPTFPGAHCRYCPAGGPHLCGDLIAETFNSEGEAA